MNNVIVLYYCAVLCWLCVSLERILDRSTIEPITGFSPQELIRQKCNRRMYTSISIHLYIYLSIYLDIYTAIYLYISIYVYIYTSIYTSTQPSVPFPWLIHVLCDCCVCNVLSSLSYLNAGMQNDIMQNHGDYTGLDTGTTTRY